MTLTVFRAGNSDVVALSPMFKDKFGIKTGSKVVALDTPEGILLKPATDRPIKTGKAIKDEFNKWLDGAMKEDAGLLDDLAQNVTNFVPIEEVHEIHRRVILRAGTKGLVRDFTLLHSAVERPKATFDGKELYPTIFLKAAALLQSICLNHPFTDGNKRTAWLSAKRFLKINGFKLVANRKDGATFMIKVDNEKTELVGIASWLKKHSQKMVF